MPLQPFNLGLRMVADGFSPLALAPSLWLDSSDSATVFEDSALTTPSGDGQPLGGWKDKSGNGRHFLQSGTSRPTLSESGPLSQIVAVFDGVDDSLAKASDAGLPTGDFTFITIALATRATAYADGQFGAVFCYGGASAGATILPLFGTSTSTGWTDGYGVSQYGNSSGISTQRGTWKSFGNRRTGTTYETLVNGASVKSETMTAATTTGSSPATIGSYSAGGLLLEGYIAEIILIPRAVTASELAALHTYLAAKWGI